MDSIKDVVWSFRVRQTPEEGRRTYQPKRCGNNNKDKDNSLKTLNDKNNITLCEFDDKNNYFLVEGNLHAMTLSKIK